METWVNLKSLGAKGDGLTDDTKAIQAAIDQYPYIYVPQGSYRISETLKLKPSNRSDRTSSPGYKFYPY